MLRSLAASLSVGLLTFVLASPAGADTTTTPNGTTTTPTAPTKKKTLVNKLHKAHELLAHADHDYDGHRAKAAEEVHVALKEVMGKHTAKPGAKNSGKTGPHHEAQWTSDEQLAEALKILQSVESEVGAKHPKVSANITHAIAEIITALKIK